MSKETESAEEPAKTSVSELPDILMSMSKALDYEQDVADWKKKPELVILTQNGKYNTLVKNINGVIDLLSKKNIGLETSDIDALEAQINAKLAEAKATPSAGKDIPQDITKILTDLAKTAQKTIDSLKIIVELSSKLDSKNIDLPQDHPLIGKLRPNEKLSDIITYIKSIQFEDDSIALIKVKNPEFTKFIDEAIKNLGDESFEVPANFQKEFSELLSHIASKNKKLENIATQKSEFLGHLENFAGSNETNLLDRAQESFKQLEAVSYTDAEKKELESLKAKLEEAQEKASTRATQIIKLEDKTAGMSDSHPLKKEFTTAMSRNLSLDQVSKYELSAEYQKDYQKYLSEATEELSQAKSKLSSYNTGLDQLYAEYLFTKKLENSVEIKNLIAALEDYKNNPLDDKKMQAFMDSYDLAKKIPGIYDDFSNGFENIAQLETEITKYQKKYYDLVKDVEQNPATIDETLKTQIDATKNTLQTQAAPSSIEPPRRVVNAVPVDPMEPPRRVVNAVPVDPMEPPRRVVNAVPVEPKQEQPRMQNPPAPMPQMQQEPQKQEQTDQKKAEKKPNKLLNRLATFGVVAAAIAVSIIFPPLMPIALLAGLGVSTAINSKSIVNFVKSKPIISGIACLFFPPLIVGVACSFIAEKIKENVTLTQKTNNNEQQQNVNPNYQQGQQQNVSPPGQYAPIQGGYTYGTDIPSTANHQVAAQSSGQVYPSSPAPQARGQAQAAQVGATTLETSQLSTVIDKLAAAAKVDHHELDMVEVAAEAQRPSAGSVDSVRAFPSSGWAVDLTQTGAGHDLARRAATNGHGQTSSSVSTPDPTPRGGVPSAAAGRGRS
jgi:hypothetical protein